MFLGQIPFVEKHSDGSIIGQGERPARPLHCLSETCSLNNQVWSIVETCWAQEPTQRPTATQVVLQLRMLPNIGVDARAPDDFSMNFPSQTLYNHTEHPFSTLSAVSHMLLASQPSNLPDLESEPEDKVCMETNSSLSESVNAIKQMDEVKHAADERLKHDGIQGCWGLSAIPR
jgi:hypothetical protein